MNRIPESNLQITTGRPVTPRAWIVTARTRGPRRRERRAAGRWLRVDAGSTSEPCCALSHMTGLGGDASADLRRGDASVRLSMARPARQARISPRSVARAASNSHRGILPAP